MGKTTVSYDIVDAHCHYWPADLVDPNMGPAMPVEQLLEDAAAAGVTRVVQVTTFAMGYDNAYSIENANRYPGQVIGVFARFDPLESDVAGRLAKLYAEPKILGVRLTLTSPLWIERISDGTLDPFWSAAERQRVPVAIWAPDAAPALASIATKHPGLRVLADHMTLHHNELGVISEDPFARWAQVLRLAAFPNVYMKVSCFPEISQKPYPFSNVHDNFKQLFDCFGPERLMWGSNYPPSKKAASYKTSVDFVRNGLPFLTERDRAQILGKTFIDVAGPI